MSLKLSQYQGSYVVVTDNNGVRHEGKVVLFTPAKDNDVNEDAIAIDSGVWLDESDIHSIHILDKTA